jgi:hypothetical protein
MRCCRILPGGHNIINPESNLGRRKTLIDADKSKNQRFSALISVQNKVLERSHLEDYFGVSHV